MPIELTDFIKPKNDAFTGIVQASQVLGGGGNGTLPDATMDANVLRADGSKPLTGNWPAGDKNISCKNLTVTQKLLSTVATGTKPVDVASTTMCTNLNADFVDGIHASAFLQNVVEDTTPQLGGNLARNGFHIVGASDLELLKFSETGSAVNEVTITNAAAGNAPKLAASGDDTNIDLELDGQNAGIVKIVNGLTVAGDFVHAGSKYGIHNNTPVSQTAAYSFTESHVTTRSWAPSGKSQVTHDQLCQVVATIQKDLQIPGFLG